MELKFDPGFREYLSVTDFEIDSQYRVNLTQVFYNY